LGHRYYFLKGQISLLDPLKTQPRIISNDIENGSNKANLVTLERSWLSSCPLGKGSAYQNTKWSIVMVKNHVPEQGKANISRSGLNLLLFQEEEPVSPGFWSGMDTEVWVEIPSRGLKYPVKLS